MQSLFFGGVAIISRQRSSSRSISACPIGKGRHASPQTVALRNGARSSAIPGSPPRSSTFDRLLHHAVVVQIEGSGVSVLWGPSATFQGRRDGGGLNVGRARRITLALPNSARSAARSATNTPFPSAGSIIASCIATATRRLGGLRPMSIRSRSRSHSLALWATLPQ